MKQVADRFWAKVDRRGPDECWLWTAHRSHLGYGHFGYKGRVRKAHRVAYALHHGIELPDPGIKVLHSCDVRACCNPAHLSLGTQAENVADMFAKGRNRRGIAPAGENHPMARLNEESVAEIRRLCVEGRLRQCEIAAMFDVCQMTVSLIARHKIWKHVGGET